MAEQAVKVQQYKKDAVKELMICSTLPRTYIFTDYRGLTVEQITNLRTRLREQNAEYKVVKNNFAKIALQRA